jgi:hypothetical protein
MWLKNLSSMYYERELSRVCGYMRARLDVLWKGNIIFLGVLENDFFMIAGDSDFNWTWDMLHWKDYLLIFSCI